MTRRDRRRARGALAGEPGTRAWERVPQQMVEVGGGERWVTGGGVISPISVKVQRRFFYFFIFDSKKIVQMFLTRR